MYRCCINCDQHGKYQTNVINRVNNNFVKCVYSLQDFVVFTEVPGLTMLNIGVENMSAA